MLVRLQKYLARAGVASRRACEELIVSGRVRVNGVVVSELGAKVDDQTDLVEFDGTRVEAPSENVTIMLNKPAGYVSTMSDPQKRPTVANLIPLEKYPALFPIGRLDIDTTGLLLFTTDGELGNYLLHPKYHVAKTYTACISGIPSEEELNILRQGIELEDGMCSPAEVCLIKKDGSAGLDTSCVEITIHEGRKRQVKRMFAAIGHKVLRLHRKTFGGLNLDRLDIGKWRELTQAEINTLCKNGR